MEGSIHKPGSLCGHSKPKLMLSQTVRQSRSLNRGFLCVFEKTIIFFKKYAFLNKKLLVSYALSMTPHMTGRGVKKIKGRLLKKFNWAVKSNYFRRFENLLQSCLSNKFPLCPFRRGPRLSLRLKPALRLLASVKDHLPRGCKREKMTKNKTFGEGNENFYSFELQN